MASLAHPLYPKLPTLLLLHSYSQTHLAPTSFSSPKPTTPLLLLLLPHSTSPALQLQTLPTGTPVEELMRAARESSDNSSLRDLLVGYEGKLKKEECVELLGQMGEAQIADQIVFFCRNVLFRETSEFSDVHVFNSAISALLRCKRYDDAWEVFEAVEANNVAPDQVTCSMMIATMREHGRSAKECWEFFERMNVKGVEWGPEVLGALVKSFCEEGLKKEAIILQTEMEKTGVYADADVYNTLMDAYCKSDHIEEAEGLYAEMNSKGVKPTSTTYNILMDAYSRRMQPEIIEELMVEMQGAGMEPNIMAYTCLIRVYAKHKRKSEMAENAFLKMREVGLVPDLHSYTELIRAYSVGGCHQKACTAFEDMLKEGIEPSVETYTALLDALRRGGDTETLMIIWKMMLREMVEPTEAMFNTILDGFAKQGLYEEAKEVVSEFGKLGLKSTVVTYNILMNAYARGGEETKLPQLLNEMESVNLKPDSITYTTMIYAYIRAQDFKRAFFYYKQMVRGRQLPDAESFQKLRATLTAKSARSTKKDKKAIREIINAKFHGLHTRRKSKKDEFWKGRKKHVKDVRQPGKPTSAIYEG